MFLGEYASWGNTYYNALVEAAFMTGLQNNAHAVGLACYAPMLCNVDYINWKPDLIWFNNHEVYGTANYYVQKLFMNHQGDQLLEIKANGFTVSEERKAEAITGAISLDVDASAARYSEITLVNNVTGEVKTYSELSEEVSNLPDPAQNGTAKRTLELGETEWRAIPWILRLLEPQGIKGLCSILVKQMIRIICIGN